MYNDLYPKEALEIYLILKLDEKNYDMQDVFYLIYHLSKSQNITSNHFSIIQVPWEISDHFVVNVRGADDFDVVVDDVEDWNAGKLACHPCGVALSLVEVCQAAPLGKKGL